MRISTDSIYSSVLRNIERNQLKLDKLNFQVSSGLQFQFAHEAPAKTVTSMRLKTDIHRLEKFNQSVGEARDTLEATDATLGNAVQLLQRSRELALQAATGSLTESDRALIAQEINELLEEMVSIGNTQFQGKFIFAGSETLNDTFNENPFVVTRSNGYIQSVQYKGDIKERFREISENRQVAISSPGNKVFAAQQHTIEMADADGLASSTAALNTLGVPTATGFFMVDGKKIYYDTSTDSLQAIVDRINQAGLAVSASVVQAGAAFKLRLDSTQAHQIELRDIDRTTGGRVDGLLDDLSVIDGDDYSATDPNYPNNIHANATNTYVDVFQTLINLRNDLDINIGLGNTNFISRYGITNNPPTSAELAQILTQAPDKIGTDDLRALDASLDGIMANRATIGARVNRLDVTEERNEDMKRNTTSLLRKVEDVDFAEVLVEFNQQQTLQQAALSTGARIFNLTLLDFL